MLFNKFADGLEFSMQLRGVTNVIHYLDDYFSVGKPKTQECENNLKIMLEVCNELGMKVNPDKVIMPSTCIEFLGIILDSTSMEMRISEERFTDVMSELLIWEHKKCGSKRELLSLLGKLVFISRIIRPGRIFTRRLFDATKHVKHLHYKINLSKDTREDIKWWISTAKAWNHKSVFYDEIWYNNSDMEMSTDASDHWIGAVFETRWIYKIFSLSETHKSIAWRELAAIVAACLTWGSIFQGRKLLIHCDNEGVVTAVNSGASKCVDIMSLIRKLFFICVEHNFDCKLRHIPGILNVSADCLSRGNIKKFKQLNPLACDTPDDVCWSSVVNAVL